MILYLPSVWPLKSKDVDEDRRNVDGGADAAASITRMPADASRADHRFLAVRLGSPGEQTELAGGEAHHLVRVLRLGKGARVAVFDGAGREFLARVDEASRSRVSVTLLEPLAPAPEPRVAITLAQAVLKGPSMDAAVRDAVMIGAVAIVPVTTAHVAVKERAIARPDARERWQRVALASVKQCRRAVLPRVDAPVSFADVVSRTEADARLIFVEPDADVTARSPRSLLDRLAPRSAALLVGPEGGWRRDEIDAARDAGWMPVTLGGLTLRAEAMALCATVMVRFLWDD